MSETDSDHEMERVSEERKLLTLNEDEELIATGEQGGYRYECSCGEEYFTEGEARMHLIGVGHDAVRSLQNADIPFAVVDVSRSGEQYRSTMIDLACTDRGTWREGKVSIRVVQAIDDAGYVLSGSLHAPSQPDGVDMRLWVRESL